MNEFVVRRHHALRAGLHDDLHLGTNGVFLSWAIPKLMPTRVNVRVLAIRTAEHSSEGARFTGTIPKGQYGAGETEVLDEGELVMISHSPNHYFFHIMGDLYRGYYYLRHWKDSKWLLWRRP